MSEEPRKSTTAVSQTRGVIAEFGSSGLLIEAIEAVRKKGYARIDAHTPFPIHGLEKALGVSATRLPWLVLAAGLSAGLAALAFQWWTNAVDYPFIISGKPLFSLPANIPVMFEVIILASAITALGTMLLRNGLPRWSNPLLQSERFRKATDDRMFLWIDARDPKFDAQGTVTLLQELDAEHVELVEESTAPARLPRAIVLGSVVLASLALVPPAMIAKARSTTSDKPRIHNFFDMDFQPKFKAQTTSTLFADGRAMRPQVAGTVARGRLPEDMERVRGTKGGVDPFVVARTQEANAENGSGSDASDTASLDLGQVPWLDAIPMTVDQSLMERGRVQFNIHCSLCHGRTGDGNGLVAVRARELEQSTWVPPTSLHMDYVREQPVGQIYNTITNGIRKMPGYKHQTSVEDRWAIAAYVKALQRSQAASLDDVPTEERDGLREIQ